MLKKIVIAGVLAMTLVACQSVPKPTPAISAPTDELKFNIAGKIGITTQTQTGRQAGSAFYTWSQEGERFAIELTGALGMGATSVSFDGQTAKLNSEKTGQLQADSPEDLLAKATGYHAPISQLPYWILGRAAPDDVDDIRENGRLISSNNHDWSAKFDYAKDDSQPNRLTMTHAEGHRVVMTIAYP